MIFVDLLYFICVSVLPTCMYVYKYHMFGWCLQRSKEDVDSPGTGVADGLGIEIMSSARTSEFKHGTISLAHNFNSWLVVCLSFFYVQDKNLVLENIGNKWAGRCSVDNALATQTCRPELGSPASTSRLNRCDCSLLIPALVRWRQGTLQSKLPDYTD